MNVTSFLVGVVLGPIHFILEPPDETGPLTASQAFLELTIPDGLAKSAYATEQLHILLRGIMSAHGAWGLFAQRARPYSLELVSTRAGGIRYVLVVPKNKVDEVSRSLLSFLPGLQIHETTDYARAIRASNSEVIECMLAYDFALPLREQNALDEYDPITFIIGHMTKLASDELVALQIVVTPIAFSTHQQVFWHKHVLEESLSAGEALGPRLQKRRTFSDYALWLIWSPLAWFAGVAGDALLVVGSASIGLSADGAGSPEDNKRYGGTNTAQNPYEIDIAQYVKAKLDQPLFEVTVRILAAGTSSASRTSRLESIFSSFGSYATSYQHWEIRGNIPYFFSNARQIEWFVRRSLSPHFLSQKTILAGSELAGLFHFPNTETAPVEGVIKNRSRELAAPLSIRRDAADFDVLIGTNAHGGQLQPIGLTLAQRQKHTYVIGKTGTGKTTLLKQMIHQDMLNGKGLAVLDPHGDLFRELLEIVPVHRLRDVVVFDPSDRRFPVGLNILDPGVNFKSTDDKHDWTASSVLSIFEKLATESQWGPRMEHNLRNATLTALLLPNPSLYTIQRLLTDKSFQNEAADLVADPVLKQFWSREFRLMGTMQLAAAAQPLTSRIGHFITTKLSRNILLQPESSIRMSDIMDSGKILLANLSKGDLGEDQSYFFGTILTSLIWMAAYQRTKIPESQRRDFFLYVDEFQNFATRQFTDITSEGRKFHLSLIASHQNIAQVKDLSILKIFSGNAHAIISLKASPEDEAFILPYMRPEVEKGDIVNLAPHHFFIKTTTDESEEAFSGITKPLSVIGSTGIADTVVTLSRERYATPLTDVETYLSTMFDHRNLSKKQHVYAQQPLPSPLPNIVTGQPNLSRIARLRAPKSYR